MTQHLHKYWMNILQSIQLRLNLSIRNLEVRQRVTPLFFTILAFHLFLTICFIVDEVFFITDSVEHPIVYLIELPCSLIGGVSVHPVTGCDVAIFLMLGILNAGVWACFGSLSRYLFNKKKGVP